MQKITTYIKEPKYIYYAFARRYQLFILEPFWKLMPDSIFLKRLFKKHLDYPLNLKNPKTFNEKIQWLKLYDRNPFYTRLADKYEVRKYIAEKIGEEYLIPLLGVWDNADEIDFEKLPEQFVLKCTHDSGSVIICKDKNNFNIQEVKKKLSKALKVNFYNWAREWVYKDIKPRIIAEEYMVDESGLELKDYKIFCFNGEAKYIQVDFDRFIEHKRNIYDINRNFLDFQIAYKNDGNKQIAKPQKLGEILDIARKLSTGIPHIRIDFYSINDKVYFGELTFYHGAGFEKFEPFKWDEKFGDMIDLSKHPKPVQNEVQRNRYT